MVDPTTGEYDDMPHIAPGNIESFTGRILDNVKTVKEEQLISGKFRFRPNDVVYGKINPQLGKCFYASVDGLTSADAYVFNGKNGITQKFLYSVLQTNDFFKYSVSVSRRSGMPKINRDELNAYSFWTPKEEEQERIGDFLLGIDDLITLHQREFKYVYYRFVINKYKNISENYICIYTKIYGGLKMNNKLELYHGSGQIVEFPEIRKTRYTKDFSWGFYCTKSYEQAYRWAERKHENGIVNVYSYIENSELNIKKFDGMCEEWLDFIAECRAGKTHPYDIVEGPMADDTIWNFVNDYLNKNISKEVFWEYARFKHPSHQISFHSIRALECLKYERSIAVENDTVE